MQVLLPASGSTRRDALTHVLTKALSWFDTHVGSRRSLRLAAILSAYGLALGLAFHFAYEIRWDFSVPPDYARQRDLLLLAVVVCKILLLYSFGQFRSVLSYFGLADFSALVFAISTVSAFMLALWYWSTTVAAPPRGVIVIDFVLSLSSIAAFRLSLRIVRNWAMYGRTQLSGVERRVAIVGAGDAGEAVAKDLLQRRASGLRPVLLIDDEPKRIGRTIHGLPVYGPLERLPKIAAGTRIDEIVITSAETSPKRVKMVVEMARAIGARTQIVPSIVQLASGTVRVERSRPVAIEDLLGRAPVNLDSEGIARLIRDRTVLVTGAGGSIGSELCRQILALEPNRLVMVDQTELALFEIEQELSRAENARRMVPLIVDIVDSGAIREVFARHRPEIVFHAAAHKHVPLMERQPAEALKNNTLATSTLAGLASEFAVQRFVLISTDKAINPTSVMGCSKRLAEKALLARHVCAGNQTAFMAVRFGNVLGSSGSVIPTFRKQIAQGGPVTVTHPEMTRYFMTIPEAVGLVLQAATLGQGGEIFILDMGQPVKIMDMARQMIELSGFRPDVDIEIKVTGLRPGEKLFEELSHPEETHEKTEHPRIFRLKSERPPDGLDVWLDELRAAAGRDPEAVKATMKRLVPEYTPFAG